MRSPATFIFSVACGSALIAGLCLRGHALGDSPAAAGAAERRLAIFYTAEIHGTLEPCGCTSDPLGDIARYAALVRAARARGTATLLVDAGGMLYGEGGISAKERPADDLRARFLADELGKLGLRAAALAETDLVAGAGAVQPPRLASNLGASAALAPAHVETIGDIKVGLLGVADPALGAALGVTAEEAMRAAQRDVEKLRRAGAEIVVLLAPIDRGGARRLAREAGADFVVAGRQVGRGMARAEKIGAAYLLQPADELQRVGRVDLVLRGGAARPLVDAGGADANQARAEEVDRALKRLDEDLARWSSSDGGGGGGGGGEASFIAAKRAERAELVAERTRLSQPFAPPAT
ncbi:MAG TPA: hypothetical protein VMU50_19610, partial [Polyangia bacterium]|nr:hypothetical protein [Polyangia bacterium]